MPGKSSAASPQSSYETVDRRVVASPAHARALLAAVRAQGTRGEHLEAFYGCLYYAALRPSEAAALREADCQLPSRGWGRIDLAGSEPRVGVPTTEVARRAVHSVAVLLKVYAHCIDGQDDTVNKRIAGALGGDEETA